MIQPLWKTVWKFIRKLGIKPPYDSEIPHLGIYQEETKIERDTCIPLFILALCTTARIWKQLRCPLKEVVVHIHNGILFHSKKFQSKKGIHLSQF